MAVRMTPRTASPRDGATGRSRRSGSFGISRPPSPASPGCVRDTTIAGTSSATASSRRRRAVGVPEQPGHDDRPRHAHLSLETTEPVRFGRGFISGLLSAILGIAGLGAVLCLHFPQYLTAAELRPFYSLRYLRAIIHV